MTSSGAVEVAAAAARTVGLASSQLCGVWTWGWGKSFQLGFFSECCSTPERVKALDSARVKTVSAGLVHSAAVTDSGLLYTFGKTEDGRCGRGHPTLPTASPNTVKMPARPAGAPRPGRYSLVGFSSTQHDADTEKQEVR